MTTPTRLGKLRETLARLAAASGRGLRWSLRLTARAASRARSSPLLRRWKRPLARGLRVVVVASLLAWLIGVVGGRSFERVLPGTVGVRQANWGSGVEEVDHPPGLYFSPPGAHTWHHLDARTRSVSFAAPEEGGQHPILELRTAQGNGVEIAATVLYRLLPGHAHRIVAEGKKLGHDLRVKTCIERVLQRELALLEVDEYFDVDRRQELCDRALERLNGELAAHHVVAERILIADFHFPATFEKRMQAEQLSSQTARTNAVLARLEARRLENALVKQELGRAEQTLRAELDAQLEGRRQVAHYAAERQRVENERLTHESQVEREELTAQLYRELAERRVEERDLPLAEAQQVLATTAHALDQELSDLELELAAELETQRQLHAVQRPAAQQHANALAKLALERQEQELAAELALELAEERALLAGGLSSLQDATLEELGRIERESATTVAELVAQGRRAEQAAEALGEELRAAVLASPGGRIYLAREAAAGLGIERVTLNADDPRTPPLLDLDALVALLVGEEP